MSIFGGADRFSDASAQRPSDTPGPIYTLPSTMNLKPRYDLRGRKNVALFTSLRGGSQSARGPARSHSSTTDRFLEPTPPPAPAAAAATAPTTGTAAAGAGAGLAGGREGGMSPESAAVAAAADAFVDPEQAVRDAIARAESGQAQRAAQDAVQAAERAALQRSVARRPATARVDDTATAPAHTRADIQRWLNETKDAQHQALLAATRHSSASNGTHTPAPPPPGTRRLKDMNRADWLETNPNRVSDGLSPAKYEPLYHSDSRHTRPPTATLAMSGRNVEWRLKWQDGLPGPKYDPEHAEQHTSKYKAPPSLHSMFAPDVGHGGDRLQLLTNGTLRHGLLLHGHAGATNEVGPGAYDVPAVNPGAKSAPAVTIPGRTDTSQLYISKKHNATERAGVCSPGAVYDVHHYDIASRAKPLEHIVRPKYQVPDPETLRDVDAQHAKHLRALDTTVRTHHEHAVERDLRHARAALARARAEQMHPGVTLRGTPAVAGAVARAEAAAAKQQQQSVYEYDPRTIPGLMPGGEGEDDDVDERTLTEEQKAARAARREAKAAAAAQKAEEEELARLKLQSPRRKSHVPITTKRVNQWKRDSRGAVSRDSWLHGTVTKRPATAPGGSSGASLVGGSGILVERHFYAHRSAPGPGAYDLSAHPGNFGNTQSFNAAARRSRARKERRLLRHTGGGNGGSGQGGGGRGQAALFAPQHLPSSTRHHKLLRAAAAAGATLDDAAFAAASASFPTYSQFTAKRLADAIAKEKAARVRAKQEAAAATAARRRAQAAQLEQHPALVSPTQRRDWTAATGGGGAGAGPVTSEHTFDADLEAALLPRAGGGGGGDDEKHQSYGGDESARGVSFAATTSTVGGGGGSGDRIQPHRSRPSPVRKLSKAPSHAAEGDAAATGSAAFVPSPPSKPKPSPFGYSAAQMPAPTLANKPAGPQYYTSARSPRAAAAAGAPLSPRTTPRVHMSPRPVLFVPRTYDGAANNAAATAGTPRSAVTVTTAAAGAAAESGSASAR